MRFSTWRRRCLNVELVILVVLPVCLFSQPYYVSESGTSNGNGTFNDPYLAIQQAADVMGGGDTCYIREGTYYETVRPANSGSSNSSQIVFRAYQNENVVVHGGEAVPASAWTHYSGNVYYASGADTPREAFVNRQYILQARHPNMPFDPQRGFVMLKQFLGTANPPAVSNWNGTLLIEGDGGTWVSKITRPNAYVLATAGILIGPLGLLDAPGEWAYVNGVFYLWPPDNADPRTSGAVVETATREFGFDLSSRDYIVVRDLTVFGASINMNSASRCIIDNCKVLYHGALFLAEGSLSGFVRDRETTFNSKGKGVVVGGDNNTVRNCEIAHSWADGVTIYGSDHTVENNKIYDCDWSGTDCAPLTMCGYRHDVRYNTIFDGGRSILVHRHTRDSRIEHNDIYGAGWMRYDLGMTYSFATDGQGTQLAYNWVHETYAYHGSAGIYLDNETESFVVHHNMIWSMATHPNFFGFGWNMPQDNQLYCNNGFYNIQGGVTIDTAVAWRDCSYHNNLVPFTVERENPRVSAENNIGDADGFYTDPEFGDFTLKAGCAAIDAGRTVAPYTDGYQGSAPDVGPYESGATAWVAGADFARKLWIPPRVPGHVSRWHWTVSANAGNRQAVMAIDGRMDTRWEARTSYNSTQEAFTIFQVDMQEPTSFNKILLFAPAAPRDCFPRSYEITTAASDVSGYGSAIATGSGTDSVTIISFPRQTARYVRITQKSTPGATPWAIDELIVVDDGTQQTVISPRGIAVGSELSRVLLHSIDGRLLGTFSKTRPALQPLSVVKPGVYAVRRVFAGGGVDCRTVVVGRHMPLSRLLLRDSW